MNEQVRTLGCLLHRPSCTNVATGLDQSDACCAWYDDQEYAFEKRDEELLDVR